MTRTAFAAAAALVVLGAPAFSAAHLSPDMTCGDYMALSSADQMASIGMFSGAPEGAAMESDAAGTTEGEDAAETTTDSLSSDDMMANAAANCEGNDDMMARDAAMQAAE